MDEKSLKTSVFQRVVILIVALLLLGSTFLTYMFVVMGNNSKSSSSTSQVDEAKVKELTDAYDAKNNELAEAAKPIGAKYFDEFYKLVKANLKSYNEENANKAVLDTKDLKVGTGRELAEGDKKYLAYYVGWCANGDVFDSSFDAKDYLDATALKAPLDPGSGLIEGWEQGVVGMKLGGVRMITMNGDLAYGDTQEICGGLNKPLKFIILAIDQDETLKKLNDELTDLYLQLYMAYYGANS